MFLQHWATCWCSRPSVEQTIGVVGNPDHRVLRPIKGGRYWCNHVATLIMPRVVVSTAAFHARVRGSVPGLGGLKETKMFLPHPRVNSVLCGASVTER